MADYLEGDLHLTKRALFDAHLAACDSCTREFDELRRTVALLRDLPMPEPPPFLAGKVMARIRQGEGRLTFPVQLSGDVPRGMVRVDGFPNPEELPEGIGINALTSPLPADLGQANVLYSARVNVRKID